MKGKYLASLLVAGLVLGRCSYGIAISKWPQWWRRYAVNNADTDTRLKNSKRLGIMGTVWLNVKCSDPSCETMTWTNYVCWCKYIFVFILAAASVLTSAAQGNRMVFKCINLVTWENFKKYYQIQLFPGNLKFWNVPDWSRFIFIFP